MLATYAQTRSAHVLQRLTPLCNQVVYNIDGFCDKNRDLLFKDLVGLAECTSSAFIAV